MKPSFKTFLLLCLVLILGACASARPAGLSDDQLAALASNLLTALDSGDHAAFIQDMSATMQAYFTEAQFASLQDMLHNSSGKFVSLDRPSLTNSQDYAVYRFPAKYELETVYVTISYSTGGDKIEGLFFDSPNLRKQAQ
jgi:hypothetical protein